MAKTSKKNKPLREKLVEAASYNLEEALDILFEHKSEKFTESVDVSINLGSGSIEVRSKRQGSI